MPYADALATRITRWPLHLLHLSPCLAGQRAAAGGNTAAASRPPLIALIEQCLAQDPKPAYQTPDAGPIRVRFWDVNVRWHYRAPMHLRAGRRASLNRRRVAVARGRVILGPR
ncbi:hypothetical protein ULF88_09945 [Halopseudomonas pachastrellae]|nr:hypothetical protein [Halopseudomonas pachastrellae]